MKRIRNYLVLAAIAVLTPAFVQAEDNAPGWEKTMEQGVQPIGVSDDFKLLTVAQGDVVFFLDDTGQRFYSAKFNKAAVPTVSPDGNYIMIQTAGSNEAVRDVYIYSREKKILWSLRDLPAVGRFSGNSEYILFSSWQKGGAILMDIRGKIIWNKGPWEIKPDWKRMLISQAGETVVFSNEGIFNLQGLRTKQMDLGPFCDLAKDGTLIANQQVVQGKIILSVFDPTGNRKWGLAIPADPAAGDEAALGVSINQEIDRVAMAGNGQGRGYLYLFDLSGKPVWAKADLPKILPGDLNSVRVARNYIRVNTLEGPRVYDLQGRLAWKAPGTEADYLISDDGQRVVMTSGNTISYQGPGNYLSLEPGAEIISEEAPTPVTTEAGSPQGDTSPVGLPGEVTRVVLPAEKAAPPVVVVSFQGVTLPVLSGEGKEVQSKCGCLVKNVIVAILSVVFTLLVLFLYQRFFGKKKW